jgi:hypothetical protein
VSHQQSAHQIITASGNVKIADPRCLPAFEKLPAVHQTFLQGSWSTTTFLYWFHVYTDWRRRLR